MEFNPLILRPCRMSRFISGFVLLAVAAIACVAQDTAEINATPSSLSFANTYVGKVTGSKVITINNLTTSGQVFINTIGFSCLGYGLSSGVAPFTLGQTQKITHYSVFFQPTTAQAYNCNFVVTLTDGTFLNVPLTGTGLTNTAASSLNKTALSFTNQAVGSKSAGQTVTITNGGTSNLTLNAINVSPLSFSTSTVTLPATIKPNTTLSFSVFYAPSQTGSEAGALDLTYNEVPDNGVTLSGNGIAAAALAISTPLTLPQATRTSSYQTTLAATGGTGTYTWSLMAGSTLPAGLTLSSAGVISGTLDASVNTGSYTFTAQATDAGNSSTTSGLFTIGVFANQGDNCNNIWFNVPGTSTPMVALNDLGTGTYLSSQGGLYPSGSNVRPAPHDSDGRAFAQAIQPLDSNGNPSPTGKYVLLGVGESTLQGEFNRFLPIANADPAKNSNLVLVNGGQGGATPNNFTSTSSVYWATTLNNYLPQNGVTANQVVAAWIEDTDGIATGSFPADIANLQSEYETMMQTMHTLFPNLKLVYFSSRVYAGYSNGVVAINPEPYAYETGFAVKWAIQDQLNNNANLNYNPNNGPVVAPWMAWGPYYWANGMLGRSDGLEWDCEDFSSDGTHPSSAYGQLKVATPLLSFLKTDNTTAPWYLAPNLSLAPTSGDSQSGNTGTTLPAVLTVLASNLNSGNPIAGVSVTFNDGGVGGSFGTPTGVTGSDGMASTTYTLPATAQTVNITASASGYSAGTFTETATAQALSVLSGDGQTGNAGSTLPVALTILASSSGNAVQGVTVNFSDAGAGGSFSPPSAVTDNAGTVATQYTLPATAKTITITASASGFTSTTLTETSTAVSQVLAATAGNNQTGMAGTTLATALTVTATTGGNPAQGVSVTFSDGGAGGSFGSPTATTDGNGQASTTYTLPATAQSVSITASSSGYTSATFSETATAPVLTLAANAGNNQSGSTGTILPTALTVLATSNGNPAQGVSVTFSDGAAGGTFGTRVGVTGTNGLVSTTYTLPATAGTFTITATSSGYTSATFSETATAPVLALAASAGNNQSGGTGTLLPTALTVLATSNGNPAQGVTVTFSDGSAGGILGTPTGVTGSNGMVSTTYTLPGTPGTFTISATSSGYTPATFSETATQTVTSITLVSGGKQVGTVGTALPAPIIMRAKNSAGKTVAGVALTFTDGGAGGSFNPNPAITNSIGQASSTYTLPTKTKVPTVTASNGSVSGKTTEQAVAGAAATISIFSGNNQTGTHGLALPKKLVVLVTDQYNNNVTGATVTFTDNGAGGSFSPTTPATGTNGQASTTYTSGAAPGTITISASTSSLAPVNFTETIR